MGEDLSFHQPSFFRDQAAFDALEAHVFPRLRALPSPARVWVVGCSTGEEAYSLAIALSEGGIPARVFATDADHDAIARARRGRFARTIVTNVGPARLRRSFVESGDGYQIRKSIRGRCVFARHDLLSDQPFFNIDLIGGRNLIALGTPFVQQRLLSLFHFGLRPSGFLWLASRDGGDNLSHLFRAQDETSTIYCKTQLVDPARVQLARVYRRPVVGQESPQSLIEQYEAANEELESAAEEIRSSQDELVKANEALELSQKSLTAELKRKDQFIAILAHELRNPLAAMGLTLEVMRRSSVAAILDEDFQAMDRQIKSLARLADDVQDMARIRQGKLTSRMAVAAVAAVGLPTPLRILVVEDNADVADRLVALLGADGHEVRLERDGLAAIASLRSFSPQAVLLDIGLPGVDGYEVARRIRQHPGLRHVVIVGLSGYAQEDARRQSKEAGFDEHLAKPVDLKVIRATLARLVASRSAGPPPLWIVR